MASKNLLQGPCLRVDSVMAFGVVEKSLYEGLARERSGDSCFFSAEDVNVRTVGDNWSDLATAAMALYLSSRSKFLAQSIWFHRFVADCSSLCGSFDTDERQSAFIIRIFYRRTLCKRGQPRHCSNKAYQASHAVIGGMRAECEPQALLSIIPLEKRLGSRSSAPPDRLDLPRKPQFRPQ
jgi:hypothetical protein